MEVEQGFVHGNKVAHLGNEFDETARSLGFSLEQLKIDGKHDARCSLMPNDTIWRTEIEAVGCRAAGAATWIGIYGLNDSETVTAYVGQNTDRAQQSGRVIDQIEERRERKYREQSGHEHDQLMDILFHSVLRTEGEHQCEYE